MHRQGAMKQTKLVDDFELNDLDMGAIPISSTLGITKLQETITKKRIKF